MKSFKTRSGQVIIESLFAISVISLCFVSLAVAMVVGLRNTKFARNAAEANQYAQEGLELARQERDNSLTNWLTFKNWTPICTPVNNFTRCITNNDPSPLPGLPVDPDKRLITVIVSWTEGSKTYQVKAETFLTKWGK